MQNRKRLPERIALFTDFGEAGPYTGQMEAVLFARGVRVPVIRLLADAPRCDPRPSAYLLAPMAEYLPELTLFLAVVDPGVGGPRRPLLVQTEQHWFVGPDNGLFSQVLRQSPNAAVREIDWTPGRLSASFHGRDLFAPAAAAVALGEDMPLPRVDAAGLAGADWPDSLAEIIYIDHYGNAFTGIRAETPADDARLRVAGCEVAYARTFSETESGRAFWYRNSIGLVEIAVNRGRADVLLGLEIGTPVELEQKTLTTPFS